MAIQQDLNRLAERTILGYAATVRELWRLACAWDSVEVSPFVVFSQENPYVPFHTRAYDQYREAITAYRAGGYVGLSAKKISVR